MSLPARAWISAETDTDEWPQLFLYFSGCDSQSASVQFSRKSKRNCNGKSDVPFVLSYQASTQEAHLSQRNANLSQAIVGYGTRPRENPVKARSAQRSWAH